MAWVYNGIFIFYFMNFAAGGEWCITGSRFDRKLEYCEQRCCDDEFECCPDLTVVIIGAVIGGIVFLAVMIVCIICVCFACKAKAGPPSAGRTIQPINSRNPYAQNAAYGQPPSYSQFSAFPDTTDRHPPPSYNQIYSTHPSPSAPPSYSDAAFPPGAVNNDFSGGIQSQPTTAL